MVGCLKILIFTFSATCLVVFGLAALTGNFNLSAPGVEALQRSAVWASVGLVGVIAAYVGFKLGAGNKKAR